MSNPLVTHPLVTSFCEVALLSVFAITHGTIAVATAISESDWGKLIGPHGAVFVLAMVGLALWGKAVKDDKERVKESEARERRHSESLAASEKHFQALIEINKTNADDLKELSIASVRAQIEGTNAVKSLTKELSGRPCGMTKFPKP